MTGLRKPKVRFDRTGKPITTAPYFVVLAQCSGLVFVVTRTQIFPDPNVLTPLLVGASLLLLMPTAAGT